MKSSNLTCFTDIATYSRNAINKNVYLVQNLEWLTNSQNS